MAGKMAAAGTSDTIVGSAPVRVAAAADYAQVGLRLIPIGPSGEPGSALSEDSTMLRETRRVLDEAGLPLLEVEVFQIDALHFHSSRAPVTNVAALPSDLGSRAIRPRV